MVASNCSLSPGLPKRSLPPRQVGARGTIPIRDLARAFVTGAVILLLCLGVIKALQVALARDEAVLDAQAQERIGMHFAHQ